MKRYLLAAALISANLFTPFNPVMAQAEAVKADLQKGVASMQAGHLDAAEKSFQNAYNASVSAGDQGAACQASFQLGIVQTALHKTSDAEKSLQTAMSLAQAVMPGNTKFQALASALLADVFLTENKPSLAEPLYEKSLPNLPTDVPALIPEKTINLALCYMRDDKMDKAEQMFKQGIAAFTSIQGADGDQTLTATINYATLQYETGHYDQALELARRVAQSKNETKTVKSTANNLIAHVYDKQGRYGKALAIAQKSLDEYRNSKSTDAVREADTLLLIGRIYKDGHKYRDAESVIDKAVAILAKAAPDNPDFSDALREKGDLFIWQGQYEKAENLINQSKSLREKYLGPEHSDVAQNLVDLGYIYQEENKYSEAEAAYKHALTIYKNTRGEKHPNYVDTLSKLAQLYRDMGKNSEAETTLTAVLQLRRAALPANSPDITGSIVNLASFYSDNGQPKKAAPLLAEVVEIDKKSGMDPAHTAGDMQNLANAQTAAGSTAQAAEMQKKALAIINSLPGAVVAAPPVAEQNRATVATSPAAVEKPFTGEKWCLCVGISNFKDSSINLKYSAKDATDFKNFLLSKGGFKSDHVKLLTDENATRQNLIDQLGDGWLAGKVKPDDLVMVYISSHGSQAMDEAHGVNFLVTYDTNKNSLLATGIPMQWLSKIIAEQVKCKRTFIMLDVCHSGAAADWTDDSSDALAINEGGTAGDGSSKDAKGIQRTLISDPQTIVPGAGQIILCSSSKSQTSWESKEYPNSVFTKRLMDALTSHGPKTAIGDAYMPLKVAVESEVLRDRGQVQTPQISGNWKGNPLTPVAQ